MRYRDKAVHARNPEVLVAGRRRLAIVAAVVLVVLLAVGGWFLARCLRSSQSQAGQGATTQMNVAKQKKHVVKKAEPKEHHGNSPDCPDTDCIAMMVNGDLLFHPGLWDNFAGPNTAATDGTAYDFTSLFEPMRKYIDASDIAVCEFETPIAPRGGPYTGYPVFNIPSEVADAAAKVGYRACTHASNHSWDQGADGITCLWDTLDQDGIAQTGSYKTEEDSTKPLVIDSPTGGGKLGLIAGTVSLNAQTPDYDWRVDRLRESGDPNHQADIDKAVAKAKEARKQGADVVAIAMHSVQEYLVPDGFERDPEQEFESAENFLHVYSSKGNGKGYTVRCSIIQPGQQSSFDNEHTTYENVKVGDADATLGTSVEKNGDTVYILSWEQRGISNTIMGNISQDEIARIAENIF